MSLDHQDGKKFDGQHLKQSHDQRQDGRCEEVLESCLIPMYLRSKRQV